MGEAVNGMSQNVRTKAVRRTIFLSSQERGKNRVRVSCSFLRENRNEKHGGAGCIQAGASVSAQNLLDDERLSTGRNV